MIFSQVRACEPRDSRLAIAQRLDLSINYRRIAALMRSNGDDRRAAVEATCVLSIEVSFGPMPDAAWPASGCLKEHKKEDCAKRGERLRITQGDGLPLRRRPSPRICGRRRLRGDGFTRPHDQISWTWCTQIRFRHRKHLWPRLSPRRSLPEPGVEGQLPPLRLAGLLRQLR